jgi:phage terminase large subunit
VETITPTIRPTPKQEEAWQKLQDLTTRFILFGGGAGGGRTWLYCEWLLVWAYFYPGSRGFIGRNELKRLMNSTFVTWSKVCAHHNIPRHNWSLDGKYNVIRFKNGLNDRPVGRGI